MDDHLLGNDQPSRVEHGMNEPSEDARTPRSDLRIALCLSGGGFRATLFHLGVLRLLRDADLLTAVKCIGSVSGGSVLAAHLVLNWDRYSGSTVAFESAARELIKFTRADVRGRVVRRWILAWLTLVPRLLKRKHWTFTNLLQRHYARLYNNATLADLRPSPGVDRPEVFFYCASLSMGAVCSFDRSGFTWDEHGEPRHIEAPTTPVALAVAASSAFPPLFPPIAISNETLSCDIREFQNRQYLTDGGVYDNLGIDRLWHSKHIDGPGLFLVSDAEGNFDWDFDTSYTLITTRNIRASDLLMRRVSTLEYAILSAHRDRLIVADIDTVIQRPDDASILSPEIQRRLRNVRTDLDAFSPIEIMSLVRHGYAVARKELNQHRLLIDSNTPHTWEPLPPMKASSEQQLREIRRSRDRRYRLWSYRDWASWASLLLVASMLFVPAHLVYRQSEQLTGTTEALRAEESVNTRLNSLAREYYRQRHRPIEPGTSVGHVQSTAGTICCLVKLKSGGPKRYILGLNNAFHPAGSEPGGIVLQPGPFDGGRPDVDAVGRFDRSLPLTPDAPNFVAGAIAEVLPDLETTQSISGFGPIRGVAGKLEVGQEVFIVGRSSGIAGVIISSVDATSQIRFRDGSYLTFEGLLEVRSPTSGRRPAQHGDGGAPVLTNDRKLAGMVIAGGGIVSFAIPIQPILDALEVDLVVEAND